MAVLPASMAEVPAMALMPVPEREKAADAPSTAPAKKTSSSSKDKKRKGKGQSDLAPAAEAPVVAKKSKAPVVNMPPPRSTLSVLQDAQTPQQAVYNGDVTTGFSSEIRTHGKH